MRCVYEHINEECKQSTAKKNVLQEKGAIGVIKLSVHSDCHVRIVSGMQQRIDGDRGVTRPQPHGEL